MRHEHHLSCHGSEVARRGHDTDQCVRLKRSMFALKNMDQRRYHDWLIFHPRDRV